MRDLGSTAVAAQGQGSLAFGLGLLDEAHDVLELDSIGLRTLQSVSLRGIAGLGHVLESLDVLLGELVRNAALNIDPRVGGADLATVHVNAGGACLSGLVQIGILEDENRRLAACAHVRWQQAQQASLPSSRVTAFKLLSAHAFMMTLPVRQEPVKLIFLTFMWLASAAPAVGP
jgi:hypothetical protein